MLLGFKRQFEPMVLDGSKFHTIRAKRKIRPRVGETCHCYGDIRQKSMHLLGRFPCVKVQDIGIELRENRWASIKIDGVLLTGDEMSAFAWRDGFRPRGSSLGKPKDALGMMIEFWVYNHSLHESRFSGDLIWWKSSFGISGVRVNEAIARCIQEQRDCLGGDKPVDHPLVQLGINDWLTEECLIRIEARKAATAAAS